MIRIDPRTSSKHTRSPILIWCINRLAREHHQFGTSDRSWSAIMSPQATGTLDHEVYWREVGDHEIKINIEALLNDLCRDEYTPFAITGPARPEALHHLLFDLLAITHRKSRMKKQRIESCQPQSIPDFDRPVHSV